MPRLLPLLLIAAYLLACSGDEAPSPTPIPSPTIDTFPTIERPPASTPTPQGAIVSLGPPEPLETSPLDGMPPPEVPPVLFDTRTGARLEPETPQYAAALEAMVDGIALIAGNTLAIRTPDGNLLRADLLLNRLTPGPDGASIAALALNSRIRLLDLDSLTTRELSFLATPISFSLDGTRLLVADGLVREGVGSYVVIPIDHPAATARLPLGSAEDPDAQGNAHWISASRLLMTLQHPPTFQILETSGASPTLIAEHPISSDQLSVSPDGSRIAVQQGDDLEGLAVEIYETDPPRLIQTLEGASLGQHYDVPSEVWSPDAKRILVVRDICRDDERLVYVDLETLEETELARGGFLYWVVSPDAKWVAYTAWPREAWVVHADASSGAVRVSDEVNAVSRPYWSRDSRYARFHPFFGGYDRCLI